MNKLIDDYEEEFLPYNGIRTFFNFEYGNDLNGKDVAFLGIPFDTGTKYCSGGRFGPKILRNYPCYGQGYNMNMKVSTRELKGIDMGDLKIINGYMTETYNRIEKAIFKIIRVGVIPIIVGGDKTICYATLAAYKKQYGTVAMIKFGADIDEQIDYEHKENLLFRAVEQKMVDPNKVIQIGVRNNRAKNECYSYRVGGITTLSMDETRLIEEGVQYLDFIIKEIKKVVGNTPCLVSFDLGFLEPAFAPAVASPQIGGLSSWETIYILENALIGLNIKGFDVVNIIPKDDSNELTAQVAGSVLSIYLSVIAKNKSKQESCYF